MTPDEFKSRLSQMHKQIQAYITNDLPRYAGNIAVDHFKENFMKGGFVDEGLQPWQKPQRFNAKGRYAASRYGTLLSARNLLYKSINYDARKGIVIISSHVRYAKIHNEGGDVDRTITVTPALRKFAWAMHYNEVGEDKQADSKWKGLALTKKESIHVKFTMPRRRFIGDSHQLREQIRTRVTKDIDRIINNH